MKTGSMFTGKYRTTILALFQNTTKWEDGDKALEATEEAERAQVSHDEVVLPGGSMTLAQLEAVLDTIPMELTFVDENNINRFFNDGENAFQET